MKKSGPTVGAATTDDSCGPIGCISASSGQTTSPQGGSPVVIRSTAGADSQATKTQSVPTLPEALPPSKNNFERFVQDDLGHSLPVFGSNLFRGGGRDFAPPTNVAPAADYLLGMGDEVLIRTWGKIDIDVRATVDRNGQIFVPRVGTLTVAGLRLDQLTEFLQVALSKQFVGFQLSVSLGQLRSIQVFVLGQARAPGVYTISSLSTLVNALFVSGGPSATGSLRDIQLKRNGVVITHFDVYNLLLSGDKGADVRLQPGDVIFIPQLGPQVAVDGEISTPGIYELKVNAVIGDLVHDAGGLTPVARRSRALLERLHDPIGRGVIEVTLDKDGLALALQGGDILRVAPISPKLDGTVTLSGNVAEPGRYAWHPGMRVSDVIPTLASLLTRGYYNRQNSIVSSQPADPFEQSPADPPVSAANHDSELNLNYAVIRRLDPADLTTHLVSFALGVAVSNPASSENKELQPGDVIVVYSKNDVALPQELQAKFVRVDGQVKAPGVYRVGPKESLRDVVIRAGGLVPESYLYASRMTRESVRLDQEEKLKALVEQESRDAMTPAAFASNTTASSGASDLEARKAYITELSKIHADGRIVLQLRPEDKTVEDIPEFQLEDGDHFFVPSTPNTVQVLGTVYNQGTLRYLLDSRAIDYINAAGGPTRNGDRKREFLIRADGTLVSRQAVSGLEHLRIYPGDAIVVPPKFKSGIRGVDIVNLAQIVSAFALSAVAVKALQ